MSSGSVWYFCSFSWRLDINAVVTTEKPSQIWIRIEEEYYREITQIMA